MPEHRDQFIAAALRLKRLSLGIYANALARQLSVQPSQISSFEHGQPGILTQATIKQYAEIVGLDLSEIGSESRPTPVAKTVHICVNQNCPTLLPHAIGGQVYITPLFVVCEPGGKCRTCGSDMRSTCAWCGRSIDPKAIRCICGRPYCQTPDELDNYEGPVAVWCDQIRERNERITKPRLG